MTEHTPKTHEQKVAEYRAIVAEVYAANNKAYVRAGRWSFWANLFSIFK